MVSDEKEFAVEILPRFSADEVAEFHRNFKLLTHRERQVLELLLAGETNKNIAFIFGTSHRTVEMQRANILSKLGVKSLVQLSALIANPYLPKPPTERPQE